MITLSEVLTALGGGILIGLSATILLAMNGRVAGISGILEKVLPPQSEDARWRMAFLISMVVTGIALSPALPEAYTTIDRPILLVVLAGLLVGYGTRLGNGCTSGHGVCGMARFSKRSFAAVGMFLMTGIITATVVGQLLGGV
jgi:uncharacterized membrane protein YedE/YeeE